MPYLSGTLRQGVPQLSRHMMPLSATRFSVGAPAATAHGRLDRQTVLQGPPLRLTQIAPAQPCLRKESWINRRIQRQPIRSRRLDFRRLKILPAIEHHTVTGWHVEASTIWPGGTM